MKSGWRTIKVGGGDIDVKAVAVAPVRRIGDVRLTVTQGSA